MLGCQFIICLLHIKQCRAMKNSPAGRWSALAASHERDILMNTGGKGRFAAILQGQQYSKGTALARGALQCNRTFMEHGSALDNGKPKAGAAAVS